MDIERKSVNTLMRYRKRELIELLGNYEKQVFDLKQLIEISKSLNSTLDYNILIDSILYTCMGQMQVLKAGIFTRKSFDCSEFTFHRNHKGFDLDHSFSYIIPENHPIIHLFTEEYRCYTLDEIIKGLGSSEGLDALIRLEPSIIVPLKAKGQINGIIVLSERILGEEFSKDEEEYLLNIGLLGGIAIHNAYLFEMTTTDMMTKLKMRHFFQSTLLEYQEDVLHSKKDLSLIMIDIDHFKHLNDSYGHSAGDIMLKQVAKVIQQNIRRIDIAARYGGEEFMILLPDTNRETAEKVAERIRKAINEKVVEYEGQKLQTTVSLGVAQFSPSQDISTKTFIDRVDKALYLSKQNGRNKVSIAD